MSNVKDHVLKLLHPSLSKKFLQGMLRPGFFTRFKDFHFGASGALFTRHLNIIRTCVTLSQKMFCSEYIEKLSQLKHRM